MGQQKEDSGKKRKPDLSFHLCLGGQETREVLGMCGDKPLVSGEFYHERYFPSRVRSLSGLSDTTPVFCALAPAF